MATKQKIRQDRFAFADRPHHRTTTLTVDAATYRRVLALKPMQEIEVEFVNDIVSSAQGGSSVVHHSIRRTDLLTRQLSTAFRNVKVRTDMGTETACLIIGHVKGASDACTGRVVVRKRY